jgi:homoserine kinase type II
MTDLAQRWGVTVERERRPERGTNNIVWFINDSFVLRVYQNLTMDRVVAEHRLLDALRTTDLPFDVPAPIATPDGATVIETPDGPAALYPMLPGRPAANGDLRELELVGAATGDLMRALGQLPRELAPIDWRVSVSGIHPAVPDVEDLVRELQRNAPGTAGLDRFASAWRPADTAYLEMDLPCQICHTDMAPGNVLIADGRVTAVLDFEVAGWDLRVCDYVAGLVQSTDTEREAEAFDEGFRAKFQLTTEERAAVPTLRLLRQIATVVWRAGRWRQGKATLDDVRERLAAISA